VNRTTLARAHDVNTRQAQTFNILRPNGWMFCNRLIGTALHLFPQHNERESDIL